MGTKFKLYFADRSEPGVFPITENDAWLNERAIETRSIRTLTAGGNSGGLHSSMTLIDCNGRNPENPKSRESGLPTEQMLEINKEGVSNTLTSVQKDNVVVEDLQIRDGRDNRSCLRSGRTPELGVKNYSIRRLTEIECERLQGFPDNWTEYGIYEKQVWINKKEKTFKIVENKIKIPKTQRYKMLGNAVTVKVVEIIAKRLNLE